MTFKTLEIKTAVGSAPEDKPQGQTRAIPQTSYHFIQLPKTNLHYMKCGDGPPLIMVPATVSKIENWRALAQFMGQRFTVYFFELPGHGQSSPFAETFSSELVAETVEAFMDALGHARFSLMGFSFGGILAMKSLYRLQHRIEKVILISPALSRAALSFSRAHLWALDKGVRALQRPRVRSGWLRLIRSRRFSRLMARLMTRVGKVEKTIPMEEVFQKVTDSTAEVLAYQMQEMINFELQEQASAFAQPCFFAMSIHDPLLDFETTLAAVNRQFAHVHVERFYFPYHQPPRPPTFEEIAVEYEKLLDQVCSS